MNDSQAFYEELKMRYQKEDRARLLMQQLCAYQEIKRSKTWWQKLIALNKAKTIPAAWDSSNTKSRDKPI